jgi:hypothetical protein
MLRPQRPDRARQVGHDTHDAVCFGLEVLVDLELSLSPTLVAVSGQPVMVTTV